MLVGAGSRDRKTVVYVTRANWQLVASTCASSCHRPPTETDHQKCSSSSLLLLPSLQTFPRCPPPFETKQKRPNPIPGIRRIPRLPVPVFTPESRVSLLSFQSLQLGLLNPTHRHRRCSTMCAIFLILTSSVLAASRRSHHPPSLSDIVTNVGELLPQMADGTMGWGTIEHTCT